MALAAAAAMALGAPLAGGATLSPGGGGELGPAGTRFASDDSSAAAGESEASAVSEDSGSEEGGDEEDSAEVSASGSAADEPSGSEDGGSEAGPVDKVTGLVQKLQRMGDGEGGEEEREDGSESGSGDDTELPTDVRLDTIRGRVMQAVNEDPELENAVIRTDDADSVWLRRDPRSKSDYVMRAMYRRILVTGHVTTMSNGEKMVVPYTAKRLHTPGLDFLEDDTLDEDGSSEESVSSSDPSESSETSSEAHAAEQQRKKEDEEPWHPSS